MTLSETSIHLAAARGAARSCALIGCSADTRHLQNAFPTLSRNQPIMMDADSWLATLAGRLGEPFLGFKPKLHLCWSEPFCFGVWGRIGEVIECMGFVMGHAHFHVVVDV